MVSAAEKYQIDTEPEKFMAALRAELDQFQKPSCDVHDLSKHSVEDIIRDIHRAVYGNGGETKGLMWKTAEQIVLVADITSRQRKCREQVVAHMVEADETEEHKKYGIIGTARKYPKVAAVICIVLFFGLSSMWQIFIGRAQATKTEQLVLSAIEKHIPIITTRLNEKPK